MLFLKDARTLHFLIKDDRKMETVKRIEDKLADRTVKKFSQQSKDYYKNQLKANLMSSIDGWNVYDFNRELDRQELPNVDYVRSEWNADFISASYPKLLVFPSNISDLELEESKNFRTEGRLPSILLNSVDIFLQTERSISLEILSN